VGDFVEQGPADVEGGERVGVARQAREVGEVNLYDEGGRPLRFVLRPATLDDTTEDHCRAVARVFQKEKIAAARGLREQFARGLRAARGLRVAETEHAVLIEVERAPTRYLAQARGDLRASHGGDLRAADNPVFG